MYVVHVHNEPPHLLRDFAFGINHIVDHFRRHLTDLLYLPRDAFEVDRVGVLRLSHYLPFLGLMVPLPVSARLNSLATLVGMPTFLAKAGLWAAAAIVRACLGDLLGIRLLLI